jgi:hypothetical protein
LSPGTSISMLAVQDLCCSSVLPKKAWYCDMLLDENWVHAN